MPTLTIAKNDYKVTKGNIVKMYDKATKDEIYHGADWYVNAFNYAKILESDLDYQISFKKIVGVIAALSPRNDWNRNKFDAYQICKDFLNKKYYQLNLFGYQELLKTKVCTFGINKGKAIKILLSDDKDIESILKGLKTINFYRCIIGDNNAICIDGHAFSIACNEVRNLASIPPISPKNYKILQTEYKLATTFINKKYNLSLKVSDIQAITWVTYKRINNK